MQLGDVEYKAALISLCDLRNPTATAEQTGATDYSDCDFRAVLGQPAIHLFSNESHTGFAC